MRKIILAAAMLGAMTSGIALAQGTDRGDPATTMPADPTAPSSDPSVPPPPPPPPAPGQPPIEQGNPVGAGVPSTTPPAPQSAGEPVPPAMPADPAYQAGPYRGALTPPPAEAMNKTYPLCTKKVQDSCRNPGGV